MTTERHRKKTARGLPPAGSTLQGRFKGETYTAIIVEAERLPAGTGVSLGGNLYPSLSAAAKAITKQSVNGRRFWRPAGQDSQ
jgi:hypothetical protein